MGPAPPMHRRSRRPALPGGSGAAALALLVALSGSGATVLAQNRGAREPQEEFGRWERRSERCVLRLPGTTPARPLACHGLRLDQQLPGLLSIRFLPAVANDTAAARQLVFAGVLLPGSRPMRCRDGDCTPELPLALQVSAIATSLAGGLELPQARVVQGTCRLQQREATCEVVDREGNRWQASGSW
ncbi:MAG: hypothetical protein ACKO0M_10455 [Cyanobium sp.]